MAQCARFVGGGRWLPQQVNFHQLNGAGASPLVNDLRWCKEVPVQKIRGSTWLANYQIDAFVLSMLPLCEDAVVCGDAAAMVALSPGRAKIVMPSGLSTFLKEPLKHASAKRYADPRFAAGFAAAASVFHIYHSGGNHWVLIMVDILRGVASVIDSLKPHSESEPAKLMLQFLAAITGDESFLSFPIMATPNFPQQRDGSACGVFACVTLLHLLRDAKIHFTQESIPRWRTFMAQAITARFVASISESE